MLRVPGTAVFLNRGKATAPLAPRATVEHLHVLSEHVLIVAIDTPPVPHVPETERLAVDELGYRDDGIAYIEIRFGYMDEPEVPRALAALDPARLEVPMDLGGASYFTIDLCRGDEPGMSGWRKRLFLATSKITADAAEYFRLPRERTVIVGSRIEV